MNFLNLSRSDDDDSDVIIIMYDPLVYLGALKFVFVLLNVYCGALIYAKTRGGGGGRATPGGAGEDEGQSKRRRVLLVIAHPDDEAMFFVPTLMSLQQASHEVSVLCLSRGDADGLGAIRERELTASCSVLGLAPGRGQVLDEPELKVPCPRVCPRVCPHVCVSVCVRACGPLHQLSLSSLHHVQRRRPHTTSTGRSGSTMGHRRHR